MTGLGSWCNECGRYGGHDSGCPNDDDREPTPEYGDVIDAEYERMRDDERFGK